DRRTFCWFCCSGRSGADWHTDCSRNPGGSIVMSIVEKAADKLRQVDSEPPFGPHTVPQTNGKPHDNAATVEQVNGKRRDSDAAARVSIDLAALRRAGLAPPVTSQDLVGREYQRIKRPLLGNVSGLSGVNI